jgi:hypothetical protein
MRSTKLKVSESTGIMIRQILRNKKLFDEFSLPKFSIFETIIAGRLADGTKEQYTRKLKALYQWLQQQSSCIT